MIVADGEPWRCDGEGSAHQVREPESGSVESTGSLQLHVRGSEALEKSFTSSTTFMNASPTP